jgi:hypothetical protein
VYLPSSAGLLFAASDQPLGGLANAARALRADPESYARFGLHRVEDVARAWQLDADGVRALAEGAVPITDDDNLLAVRSARLRNRALELPSARRLFEQRDPLRGLAGDLDRGLLMRWLARDGQARRARELAKSDEEAVVERDLGWVDLADNRLANAARHFSRARSLAPGDRDALLGLVASRRAELADGPVSEVPESDLDAPAAAVLAGWRAAERGDEAESQSRDADLARIAPGHPLFRDAARQRALWRLASGDRTASAEATAILAQLLTYEWRAEDALLYARAAIAAEEPAFAWGALERTAAQSGSDSGKRENLRRVFELALALPPEWSALLREHLLVRGGPPRADE